MGATGGVIINVPGPTPQYVDAPTSGTYTYTLKGITSGAVPQVATPDSNAGIVFALELS